MSLEVEMLRFRKNLCAGNPTVMSRRCLLPCRQN